MKESRKAINDFLNKRSMSSNIDCRKESGSETVHKEGIFNAMSSFVCSVGRDLADKTNLIPNPFLQVTLELTTIRPNFTSGLFTCRRSRMHLPKSFGTI